MGGEWIKQVLACRVLKYHRRCWSRISVNCWVLFCSHGKQASSLQAAFSIGASFPWWHFRAPSGFSSPAKALPLVSSKLLGSGMLSCSSSAEGEVLDSITHIKRKNWLLLLFFSFLSLSWGKSLTTDWMFSWMNIKAFMMWLLCSKSFFGTCQIHWFPESSMQPSSAQPVSTHIRTVTQLKCIFSNICSMSNV